MDRNQKRSVILLIHCRDQKGIVASVTDFISKNNGNILYLDQYVDAGRGMFFMRVEWDLDGFSVPPDRLESVFSEEVGGSCNMHLSLYFSDERPRMAVFVSKLSHCLYDILSRCQSGEWRVEVPLIISNHPDLEAVAKGFGIDYHYIPVTKDNKAKQEKHQVELLKAHNIDFVALARYMQILTADFVSHFPNRIINIHHAFLPAFPGAKPYHSAYERGVKIIG
ncbi:MAG: formyltetrahydrofolate deformylase, partial [Proteobacteria bacterium]|nr:formyltetrahydrofolate deformylase [Pseudomonadota bacterium]